MAITTENICPVCGYDNMEYPADFGEICSCCGTMFGESDAEISHDELRHRWCMGGCKWWNRYEKPPLGWSPLNQLLQMGYTPTPEEYEAMGIRLREPLAGLK